MSSAIAEVLHHILYPSAVITKGNNRNHLRIRSHRTSRIAHTSIIKHQNRIPAVFVHVVVDVRDVFDLPFLFEPGRAKVAHLLVPRERARVEPHDENDLVLPATVLLKVERVGFFRLKEASARASGLLG